MHQRSYYQPIANMMKLPAVRLGPWHFVELQIKSTLARRRVDNDVEFPSQEYPRRIYEQLETT